MLQLRGVSKTYGETTALAPTDLVFSAGQTSVLIGPSGCGKSTLLRICIGLINPDQGEVELDGDLLRADNVQSLRHRMGYVIQSGGLFPHLTARRNVTLMSRHLGWEQAKINARLEELAALTRFPTDGLDRFPGQLSGGQRQRVSLMRALMLDPDWVLLDEPLGALDPLVRAELQTDLREIFRELNKTVIMVTHDMAEAAFFGDSIVLLQEGRIVQHGTFDELLHEPADPFVTSFINAQRSHLDTAEGAA